jgi:transcriptional regulator
MYIPTAFRQTDRSELHRFIETHAFGLLVSTHDGEPFATHLPFLLERDAGPHGALLGHLARANPQWRGLDGREVLAVFSGPHAYVSPSWYEAENVVPTWNYVAVHAYGTFRLVEEGDELTRTLAATVAVYEGARPQPWSLDTGTDFFRKMAKQVVGFRIEVHRLEGKWKLSQNHPRERQEKVARALAAAHDPDARAVARLMAALPGVPGDRGPAAPPG